MIQHEAIDPHEGTLRDLAPDLTPMLDILFILLVFFMLTAGAVFQSLDITLPSSVSEELTTVDAPNHIMLEISESTYSVDGKQVSDITALKTQLMELKTADPERDVLIASDKNVQIERVLNILTTLQAEGISTANILMKQEQP